MLSWGACGRDGWSGSGTPPGGAACGGGGWPRTNRPTSSDGGWLRRSPGVTGPNPGSSPRFHRGRRAPPGRPHFDGPGRRDRPRLPGRPDPGRGVGARRGGPATSARADAAALPQSFEDRPDTIELVRAALREVRRLTESEQPNAEELSDGELSALSLDRPPIAISKPGDSGQTLVRVWRARCCSRYRGRRCRPIDRPGASRATSRSCSAPVSSRLTRPTKDTALSV